MTIEARLVPSSVDRGRVDEVQRLAQGGASSVAALIGLLGEPSWVVRRAVVAALARLGNPAVPALSAVVGTGRTNEASLAAAVDALVLSGGDVESAVLRLAAHTDDTAVVRDVAQILGRRKSSSALPALPEWCRHADDNVAVSPLTKLFAGDRERIRIGAMALLDVHHRHLERTGDPEGVPRAFTSVIPCDASASIEGALHGASAAAH